MKKGRREWTTVHPMVGSPSMEALTFILGVVLGGAVGAGLFYFFGKKSADDAESIAEKLSAILMSKQAEQILQLAETKLSGKKELIDGTLQTVKHDLKRVEELMRDIGKGNTQIDTRLANAATIIKDLTETTGSLKNALSSNSGRGQWGERMAEDVLRLSGLVEGINYIKQKKLD